MGVGGVQVLGLQQLGQRRQRLVGQRRQSLPVHPVPTIGREVGQAFDQRLDQQGRDLVLDVGVDAELTQRSVDRPVQRRVGMAGSF